MLLDGADMTELLISVGHGAILREYHAPPNNVGWFREDGSAIDWPERHTLNALLHTGFMQPQQMSGENGDEFGGYKLTEKGLRFVELRGNNVASIEEFFWTIIHEHEGSSVVYFHVGKAGPDLSRIIANELNTDQITIGHYEIDAVPSEALLLTDDQLGPA
jgi:hypothetical protein